MRGPHLVSVILLLVGLTLTPLAHAVEGEPEKKQGMFSRIFGGWFGGKDEPEPVEPAVEAPLPETQPPPRAALPPSDEKKKGLLSRTWETVWPFDGDASEKAGDSKTKGLQLECEVEPEPLILAETRRLKITISLANESKRLVRLDFPNAQRFDVVLKDAHGNRLDKWSEDQFFAQAVGYVAINPSEKVVYRAKLSTRSLKPGETYEIEVFFPSYPELRAVREIQPER